jgi:hypothetical protein
VQDHREMDLTHPAGTGYDAEVQELEAELPNGNVHSYSGVPESVHRVLISSNQHGAFFDEQIPSKYPKR